MSYDPWKGRFEPPPMVVEYITVEAECIHATDRAILVAIGGDEVWIPLSQVGEDSEVLEPGDAGTLSITTWIAKKKGL